MNKVQKQASIYIRERETCIDSCKFNIKKKEVNIQKNEKAGEFHKLHMLLSHFF